MLTPKGEAETSHCKMVSLPSDWDWCKLIKLTSGETIKIIYIYISLIIKLKLILLLLYIYQQVRFNLQLMCKKKKDFKYLLFEQLNENRLK